jgi:hypothetical protein
MNSNKQTLSLNELINFIEKNFKNVDSEKVLSDSEPEIVEQKKEIMILPYDKMDNLELTKLNNLVISKFFTNVSLKHIGIITYIDMYDGINISYISSILYLLLDGIETLNEKIRIDMIDLVIRRLTGEARYNFDVFEYSNLKWVTKDFVNNIRKLTGNELLRYVADFFIVNVFVIDISKDCLTFIGTEKYVKYKKNLFLVLINNSYEPVIINDNKYQDYKSPIIDKIISNNIVKDSDVLEDLTKYMNKEVIEGEKLEVVTKKPIRRTRIKKT